MGEAPHRTLAGVDASVEAATPTEETVNGATVGLLCQNNASGALFPVGVRSAKDQHVYELREQRPDAGAQDGGTTIVATPVLAVGDVHPIDAGRTYLLEMGPEATSRFHFWKPKSPCEPLPALRPPVAIAGGGLVPPPRAAPYKFQISAATIAPKIIKAVEPLAPGNAPELVRTVLKDIATVAFEKVRARATKIASDLVVRLLCSPESKVVKLIEENLGGHPFPRLCRLLGSTDLIALITNPKPLRESLIGDAVHIVTRAIVKGLNAVDSSGALVVIAKEMASELADVLLLVLRSPSGTDIAQAIQRVLLRVSSLADNPKLVGNSTTLAKLRPVLRVLGLVMRLALRRTPSDLAQLANVQSLPALTALIRSWVQDEALAEYRTLRTSKLLIVREGGHLENPDCTADALNTAEARKVKCGTGTVTPHVLFEASASILFNQKVLALGSLNWIPAGLNWGRVMSAVRSGHSALQALETLIARARQSSPEPKAGGATTANKESETETQQSLLRDALGEAASLLMDVVGLVLEVKGGMDRDTIQATMAKIESYARQSCRHPLLSIADECSSILRSLETLTKDCRNLPDLTQERGARCVLSITTALKDVSLLKVIAPDLKTLHEMISTNVLPLERSYFRLQTFVKLGRSILAGDLFETFARVSEILTVLLPASSAQWLKRSLTGLQLIASYFSTAKSVETKDPKEAATRRQEVVKQFMDAMTNRTDRYDEHLFSLGVSVGLATGGQMAFGSGERRNREMLPQLYLPVGLAYQYQWSLENAARTTVMPLGIHAMIYAVDIAQYLAYDDDLKLLKPSYTTFLSLGVQLGFALSTPDLPVIVGFDLRYSPVVGSLDKKYGGASVQPHHALIADTLIDQRNRPFKAVGYLRFGFFVGMYVPFLDLR